MSKSIDKNGLGLGPGWSWGSQILPYLEEQNLPLDLSHDIADPVNEKPRLQSLADFRCPSDPVVDATFVVHDESEPS